MATNESITIYFKTFWWVYLKVYLYNIFMSDTPVTGKMKGHQFRFRGKNYFWIYWITIRKV